LILRSTRSCRFSIAEEGKSVRSGLNHSWHLRRLEFTSLSLDTPGLKKFVEDFPAALTGDDRVQCGDPAESAYPTNVGVFLTPSGEGGKCRRKSRTYAISSTRSRDHDWPSPSICSQVKLKCFPNHHTSNAVMIGEAEPSRPVQDPPGQRTAIPRFSWNQFVPETKKGYTCDWTRIVLMPAKVPVCISPGIASMISVEPIGLDQQ